MKINNRKLARRIRENEEIMSNLTASTRPVTVEWVEALKNTQRKIDADVATLAAHGYDKRGKKVQS